MQAKISSKGRITIPKSVREHLHVRAGGVIEFRMEGEQVLVEPVRRRSLLEFQGRFPVGKTLPYEQERALARPRALHAFHRTGRAQSLMTARRLTILPAFTRPVDAVLG